MEREDVQGTREPVGAQSLGEPDVPNSADGVLDLVRGLLEQDRSAEALRAIERFAAATAAPEPGVAAECDSSFARSVSDRELELAFESAESDREQMLDADEIAQRAIRQTESIIDLLAEIPSDDDDFVSPESSYATRTVATLLEIQGAAPTASRIRAIVESSERAVAKPAIRDRRTAAIMELERWLVNLQLMNLQRTRQQTGSGAMRSTR